MKKLEILFADKQHLQITDIVDSTGISKSKIARAAMQLGLKSLRESGAGINDKIAINDLKATH